MTSCVWSSVETLIDVVCKFGSDREKPERVDPDTLNPMKVNLDEEGNEVDPEKQALAEQAAGNLAKIMFGIGQPQEKLAAVLQNSEVG